MYVIYQQLDENDNKGICYKLERMIAVSFTTYGKHRLSHHYGFLRSI